MYLRHGLTSFTEPLINIHWKLFQGIQKQFAGSQHTYRASWVRSNYSSNIIYIYQTFEMNSRFEWKYFSITWNHVRFEYIDIRTDN